MEHAVRAGPRRGTAEGLDTEGQDGVVVGEEHDRHRGLGAHLADHLEDARQRDTPRERPLRRPLDHRPVGHGIGEWNPELDDVGAALGRLHHETAGRVERGIARGEVRHQRALAAPAQ